MANIHSYLGTSNLELTTRTIFLINGHKCVSSENMSFYDGVHDNPVSATLWLLYDDYLFFETDRGIIYVKRYSTREIIASYYRDNVVYCDLSKHCSHYVDDFAKRFVAMVVVEQFTGRESSDYREKVDSLYEMLKDDCTLYKSLEYPHIIVTLNGYVFCPNAENESALNSLIADDFCEFRFRPFEVYNSIKKAFKYKGDIKLWCDFKMTLSNICCFTTTRGNEEPYSIGAFIEDAWVKYMIACDYPYVNDLVPLLPHESKVDKMASVDEGGAIDRGNVETISEKVEYNMEKDVSIDDFLKDIFSDYSTDGIRCETGTPISVNNSSMAEKAIKNFGIPKKDSIYYIHDGTIFGSCKKGTAICSSGIYYKENVPEAIKWEEFASLKITTSFGLVKIGDELLYTDDTKKIISVFEAIQKFLNSK